MTTSQDQERPSQVFATQNGGAGEAARTAAPRKKALYISALNLAACMAVIYLHVNGCFWEGPAGISWVSANIIETFFYWAVPIFFMLSGATLMDYRKRMDTCTYFGHRVRRTVIPYVFWSLVATAWFVHASGWQPLSGVITNLLSPTYEHVYWFFIPLFGIYLSIPVFSTVQPRDSLFNYLIAASIILQSVLPLACSLFGLGYDASIIPAGAAGYFAYALIGYQLAHARLDGRKRAAIYLAGIAGWLMQLFGTLAFSAPDTGVSEVWKGYTNLPALMQSIAVFVLFRYADMRLEPHIGPRMRAAIFHLAGFTFGVYLIHMYVIMWLPEFFGFDIHRMIWRLFGPFLVFALSAAVIAILRKIPVIRHVAG